MNHREMFLTCLERLYRALTVADQAQALEAAGMAFLHFQGALESHDPLVLSCANGELFVQSLEVPVSPELGLDLARCLEAAGIVCVLFQRHMAPEDLHRLVAVLRGDSGKDLVLADPEGPFGEGRGIRIFTRPGVAPALPVGA